ncbi:MAG: transcription antitermination factor NusB [Bacteriovoracaceae bacterium]
MIIKTGRHEAREYSFQFLFHLQIHGFEDQRSTLMKANNDQYLDDLLANFEETIEYKLDQGSYHFAHSLIKGTLKCYQELEKTIEHFSKNWQLHRISKVDHAILLQAIYELTYIKETPTKVVINESLEIAKKYGAHDSKNFINGILDSVAKSFSGDNQADHE